MTLASWASMEPSRERDGVALGLPGRDRWTLCFNGAVARTRRSGARVERRARSGQLASMEPSRERDGVGNKALADRATAALQWSRRANATEWGSPPASPSAKRPCFNGAVARTRRSVIKRTREDHEAWLLQWSRRANATECLEARAHAAAMRQASMEPSRERDGVISATAPARIASCASMEPSRERDGVLVDGLREVHRLGASMEPSRERDGVRTLSATTR